MENIKLNANKILIEPITEKQIGNIIIPLTAKKDQNKGRIVVTGPIDKEKSNVKVGNIIHYNTRNGIEVEIEDKKYVLLDVNAVIFYI